jgi:hypothetical protein
MTTKDLALAASITMLVAISGLASRARGRIVPRSDQPLGPASATCLQCLLSGASDADGR